MQRTIALVIQLLRLLLGVVLGLLFVQPVHPAGSSLAIRVAF